jgi:hypothetical protein
MGSNRVYHCQWPKCPFFAFSEIRRGEGSAFLFLCVHHGNQFRAMTNGECAELAARCEPVEWITAGTRYVARIHDPVAHDAPMRSGRRVA